MSPSVTTNAANANNHVHKKRHSKKTRIVRRRGRGSLESDDEIEREIQTDSDTDDDSSFASGSDSESVSDDDEHHAGIVTPSTTQSPPPLDIPSGSNPAKPSIVPGGDGPFVGTTDWAQIVADNNGAEDLPVIDFADMHNHAVPGPTPSRPARTRKAQKQNKKATFPSHTASQPSPVVTTDPAPASEPEPKREEQESVADEPGPSTTRTALPKEPHRFRSQSARQAYQERLQADPAFVPRVGEFWGHDDRLLEKDLRSLSGWWRGRWQNRGRGRGFAMRGRGGRGFFPGHGTTLDEAEVAGDGKEKSADLKQEVPPIEKAWTHDGFEEMKRREEQRRDEQRRSEVSRQPVSPQRGGTFRGRGGSTGRGRGGFARGGGASSSVATGLSRGKPHLDPSTTPVWYTMKPEKVWTKHADSFLYYEQALRHRTGETAGIRVKIPGVQDTRVVRSKIVHAKTASQPSVTASTSVAPPEDSERHFVVRIPALAKLRSVPEAAAVNVPASESQMPEPSIEEVFTVRPQVVPEHVPIESPAASRTPSAPDGAASQQSTSVRQEYSEANVSAPSDHNPSAPSSEYQDPQLHSSPPAEVHAPVPQAAPGADTTRPVPPFLHPIQTSFSPVPATSPPYGSPYPYGALPPGIAMSHQGYPYELATGRAVYLHPTPPPMYAPQPIMQSFMGHPSTSVPFVPGHVHHPSQEYMPHPHTPVNGFVDPSTGVPIFTPPRHSSRIEIRAPSERSEGKHAKPALRPSTLRTSMTEDEVAQAAALEENPSDEAPLPQQVQPAPAVMAYPAYQQQYYYPDPNGYPGYMDMSGQVVQYDMYPPYEQHAQPVIYY
jgi:hypothetical protein